MPPKTIPVRSSGRPLWSLPDSARRKMPYPLIPPPAAIPTPMFLPRLHPRFPVQRSAIHIFEPASERGTPGVEELQQQTVGLLSFKSMPKKIFDAQLSFNMLAQYGEDAPVTLESAELR